MEEPSAEEYYRMSTGSGTAASLLFLHVALAGYLGFAMVFLLRHWRSGVVGAPAMAWQYYFPAGLALFSYFPTDALTRTVAVVARLAGALAILAAIICAALWLSQASPSRTGMMSFVTVVLFGLGAAVLSAEWFRAGLTHLPSEKQRPIWPLARLHRGTRRVAVGVSWMLLMLLIGGLAARSLVLAAVTAAVCLVLVASQLVRLISSSPAAPET
jgi:hypothetical protein